MKRGNLAILVLAILFISGTTAYADDLIFSDDFGSGVLNSDDWISGSAYGDPNTITVTGGRVQATANGNYIETKQEFSGNLGLRIEVDVEKDGNNDHGCWDFMIELRTFEGNAGVIRFDADEIDGIAIGNHCPGGYFPLDGNSTNIGKAIFSYSDAYLLFSFINNDGDVLHTVGKYVGEFSSSKIRIYLAAHSDSPRYVDNVKVYSISQAQSWRRNPANNHFYRLIDSNDWVAAEGQAEQRGVHLVTINDAEEESWLQSEFGTTEDFWIGFNDIADEGNWVWESGEISTYSYWCSGEPDDYDPGQDAAILDNSGCWFDVSQTSNYIAILEYAASPNYTGGEPVFQGFIHNVHEPNGDSKTYIEVIFGDYFTESLPNDISTITVETPSGDVLAEFTGINGSGWTYSSQWRDFWTILDDSPPELGVYTFIVAGDGFTENATDHQYIIRTIPTPDTNTFVPANNAIVYSKTPTFSWDPVDLPGVPLYYRLIIDDGTERVYSTGRVQGMTSHTVPPNILQPGEIYYRRVRVFDAAAYSLLQNRANSANESADPVTGKLSFTMAPTLIHSAPPAIDLDGWGVLSWTWDYGNTGTECWVRVYDHDGVSSNGASHTVTVRFPDSTVYPMEFIRSYGSNSAGYEFWKDTTPQSGEYLFTVTDPSGNVATLAETLSASDISPLDPPDDNSITPNILDQTITARFDNVNVTYDDSTSASDDFESYSSIDDIDYSLWSSYDNAAIGNEPGNNFLEFEIGNTIGRANGALDFNNPQSLTSIRADITVTGITSDKAKAEIAGTWCHNGIGDVFAKITVTDDGVYYSVSQEYINEQETYQWDNLKSDVVLPGDFVNVPVTAEISWNKATSTFIFTANGTSKTYTVSGNVGPPIFSYKNLRTRIDLITDTTPTFTIDPVPGANRCRLRFYNYDNENRREVWSKVVGIPPTGPVSITVPPGKLKPNSFYRFRMEAWDSHNPINVNNVSKTPPSNDDNYRFYTSEQEDDFPYIDLANHGVHVWYNASGSFLQFWIKVHDAQGVPDNIEYVKVIHPGGQEEVLQYYGDNPFVAKTPTSAIYYLQSTLLPVDGGIYTFDVLDKNENSYQVTEELNISPIGTPNVSSLSPAEGANIDDTAVNFSWNPVTGAAFYAIEIFDYDFNRVYQFFATDPFYNLAAGFLKENTFYRWRVNSIKEFFDENVDNRSSSPGGYLQSLTFTTTSPTDTDGDGLPDWWEDKYGLNPYTQDSDNNGILDQNEDLDGEGLTNLDEYNKATNPNNWDTDGDEVNDADDFSPLDASESNDSDGDGIGDNSDPCPYDLKNDSDKDGICGNLDNCPTDSNAGQEDYDEDSLGDACDNCPLAYNVDQADADHDRIGDVCDYDNDNDGVDDEYDSCAGTFNPNQEDIDEDLVGDACDNCPKLANTNQYDYDNDGMGDACESGDGFQETLEVVDTDPQQPGEPLPKQPGEPLWITATFENNSPEPVETIKPDCFNTSFHVTDSDGNTLPPRYRIRAAYGIPKDVVTLPPGPFSVTCDLADMFPPEILRDPFPVDGEPEPYTVVATYSNDIQDPDLVNGVCNDPPCSDLFVGAVTSPPATVKIEGTTVETRTAECSFSPNEWYWQWTMDTGPPVTASITNIKNADGNPVDVGTVDPETIRLNGTLEIIAGSARIVDNNNTLEVQFDRSSAVTAVSSGAPGEVVASLQGKFTQGEAVFSGQAPVYILYYIDIQIDIKPGSYPNSINLKSKGTVPVAILSTLDFDAATVDPTTVKLAGAPVKLKKKGNPMASLEDVNGDDYQDLVVHIDTQKFELNEGDTQAYLAGETYDGAPIKGVDTVNIVP